MPTSPDDLREVRQSYSVTYLQILKGHGRNPSALFACVEGLDGSYFKTRISSWLVQQGSERDLITLNCGGKEEVLRLRKATDANQVLRDAYIIYIVDRDFGNAEEAAGRDDTFVTTGYSTESYYFGSAVAKRILEEHVYQDKVVGEDFEALEEALRIYSDLESKYVDAIRPFNEWAFAVRARGGKRVSFEPFDSTTFIVVDLSQDPARVILCPQRQNFDVASGNQDNPVTEHELEQARLWADNVDSPANFRGKQHAIFMLNSLAALGKMARKGQKPFCRATKHTIPCSLKAFIREWSGAAMHCGALFSFLTSYFASRNLDAIGA